jgi:hypothetical protein
VTDSGYVRPRIETPTFRDDAGRIIPYGNRWGSDVPPSDTHSVVHHSERFAPLVTVAEALIVHLVRTRDVSVEETTDPTPEREMKYVDPSDPDRPVARRSVKITPNRCDAAQLTMVFTGFPSLELQAGVFFASAFPGCGCDACDEEWSAEADRLEKTTLAVAHGTFSESLSRHWVETVLAYPGQHSRWTCRLKDLPYSAAYIAVGRRHLKSLPGRWQAWPQRP